MSPALLVAVLLSIAYLPFAIVLSAIDVRQQRLPNAVVLRLSLTLLVLGVALAVLVPAARGRLAWAAGIALVLGAGAIGAALLSPGAIGMGDAKTLPAVVFLSCVWSIEAGIGALLGGALLAGALGAAAWWRTGRAGTRFALGPVLLAAPFLGVLLAPAVRSVLGTA